jgi:thioredoxin reductase (NADPH)
MDERLKQFTNNSPTVDQRLALDAFRSLTTEEIDAFRPYGETERFAEGDYLFHAGDDQYCLYIVLSGELQIIDPTRDGDDVVNTATENAFLGEIGLLTGQRPFLSCRATKAGEALCIHPRRVQEIVSRAPELSDILVAAYSARREILMQTATANLVIFGDDDNARVNRLREFTSRNRIPHRWVAPDSDEGKACMAQHNLSAEDTVVILHGKTVLHEPSNPDVAQAIGMNLEVDTCDDIDLLVVGAGPGGLAASVYGASEGLNTVTIEDTAIGGQAGTSSRIENYMGFPTGISGGDLAYRGQIQAIKFGARFATPRRASSIIERDGKYTVTMCNGTDITTKSVVVACGVQYRRLPIERLEEYEGAGVYYAATDLEARFCAGTEVIIVGGGNSAGQAAMFLSRHAKHVHLMIRRDNLADTMSSYLINRLESDARITIHTYTEIDELQGGRHLEQVVVKNNQTGDKQTIDCRAVFIMIGAAPNTNWLEGMVELDEKGFIRTGQDVGGRSLFETSKPGIFAIGDIRSGSVKRVASSVGEGSVVVSAVHQHVSDLPV